MTATEDFQAFLCENELTEESMQEALHVIDAFDPLVECHRVYLAESKIAGRGMFTKEPIAAGCKIAPIMESFDWTLCGRYTNHSHEPNTRAVRDEYGFHLEAIRDISQGEEITANYRQIKSVMESVV